MTSRLVVGLDNFFSSYVNRLCRETKNFIHQLAAPNKASGVSVGDWSIMLISKIGKNYRNFTHLTR